MINYEKIKLLSIAVITTVLFGCQRQGIEALPSETTNNVIPLPGIIDSLIGNNPRETGPQKIVGYVHHLQTTNPTGYQAVENYPDSLDIVNIFGNFGRAEDFSKVKARIKYLQDKGTLVLHTTWINWFQDRKKSNGTRYYDPTDPASYEEYAYDTYEAHQRMGVNGLDIDVEPGIIPSSTEETKKVIAALGKYFGPKSNTGMLLVFGTDQQPNSSIGKIFEETYQYFNQVWFQAYNCSGDRWYGDSTALTNIMNFYGGKLGNENFFALGNGQKGCAWKPSTHWSADATILGYARWCKKVGAGGVGAYGLNYDYDNNNYENVREAIRILNPPNN